MTKKMNNNTELRIMDIKYTNSYNPESVELSKKTYRYIVDGDGKEMLVEEINEEDEDETD